MDDQDCEPGSGPSYGEESDSSEYNGSGPAYGEESDSFSDDEDLRLAMSMSLAQSEEAEVFAVFLHTSTLAFVYMFSCLLSLSHLTINIEFFILVNV